MAKKIKQSEENLSTSVVKTEKEVIEESLLSVKVKCSDLISDIRSHMALVEKCGKNTARFRKAANDLSTMDRRVFCW